MNYLINQCQSLRLLSVAGHLLSSATLVVACFASSAHAAGEVTFIDTIDQPATPTRYSIDGTTYSWGMGQNQVMQGFTSHGEAYEFASSADRVELVRHDVNGVSSGNPCGVFVERLGASSEVLKANYPSDGTDTGNCDMAAMLASRVVNRGALNLFSNIGPNPKNVERVDYLFDTGLLAPLGSSALASSGHVVAEKSGNNPLQIAAITAVDIFGQPSAYGPLVLVDRNGCFGDTVCYGLTNLHHNYTFFQNNSTAPQGFPSFLKDSTETVGMAFVSLARLGLQAGQLYYGFSYFGDDVNASDHTLTDVTTFPQDTDDEQILFGDGPDIYGGVSGYFIADTLNVATGAVFKDENGDGQFNENEAGISDVGLTLYIDSNGNGVFDPGSDAQVGPHFMSDIRGEFHIPGLDDGVYFLLLDEADDDIPPGISVAPGTNPAMIVISGDDADGINFSFISDAGTDAGNTDAGNTDAGESDAGSDSGATDAGPDTGEGDAGPDFGETDAATDAGESDAGTDTGESDAGTDSGETDAGADAGESDAGADAGESDVGTDAGESDAGTDAGESDAGADAGESDAGSTDGDFLIINDGTNETIANPDTASVLQGSTGTIDVLANDLDAAGDGLSIISVTESPNATIEIKDGVILYTPDFGFMGTDSFLYVVQDGAGAQSTGTVSVTVLRYSDINGNGLNDFDECDCDNLTIEVGVEGSALGASSLISFILLSLMFGCRGLTRIRHSGGACK